MEIVDKTGSPDWNTLADVGPPLLFTGMLGASLALAPSGKHGYAGGPKCCPDEQKPLTAGTRILGGPFKGFPEWGKNTVKWGIGKSGALKRAAEIGQRRKQVGWSRVRYGRPRCFTRECMRTSQQTRPRRARTKLMDRILQLQGGKLNGLPSPVQGRNAIGRQECLGPAALICPGTLGGMSFQWNRGSSSSSSAMVPKEGADSPWTIGTTDRRHRLDRIDCAGVPRWRGTRGQPPSAAGAGFRLKAPNRNNGR